MKFISRREEDPGGVLEDGKPRFRRGVRKFRVFPRTRGHRIYPETFLFPISKFL